jgi:hypothetical protein
MDLYRYISITEFYNLLHKREFKFTKLSLMSDKNESILSVIKEYDFDSLSVDRDSLLKRVSDSLNYNKEKYFISCWTTQSDSIAMWELYSKNNNFIKIKISSDKLLNSINDFIKNNYWTKHIYSEPETLFFIINPLEHGLIKYENMLNKFNVGINLFDEYHKKYLSNIRENSELIESNYDFYNKNIHKKLIGDYRKKVDDLVSGDSLFIKDFVFNHEKEYRYILTPCFRNNTEYLTPSKRKNPLDIMYESNLIDFNFSENLSIISVKLEHDIIDEICFDPRMPVYEKDAYIDMLGLKNDNRIISSKVFDSLF